MPDITLTIDGQTVTVPAGTNIVDAARTLDVSIPVFCYHPKMKAVGMCRMCLVEVYTPMIDRATGQPILDDSGQPKLGLMMNKLQTGCTTPVSQGMVVKTVTEKVEFAQRGQLEFLLTSHPLDCPVCDKGGECPLQNLTMQWGPGVSRFDYADKVHFEKPIPLGDLIYLDRERCILCARCVRFQDEIADDPVLGFDNRGRSWEIISKSDPPFNSKFSGNTTDICPVGALTSADFRFKARVWELQSVPSICPHCPVGCNVSLDMRYNEMMRVMPRENDYVNEIWICDKARFGMRFFEQEERLTTPMIRRGDEWAAATWDEAYQLIGERFAQIQNKAGGKALAGLAGPKLPNEDLYLFQKLFHEVLKSNNLDHRAGSPTDPVLDDLPRQVGVGAGTNLMTLGKGTAILVVGADPEEEAPLYIPRLRGIVTRGGDVTVVNSYPTKLDRSATSRLRIRPGTEAYLVMGLMRAIIDEKLQDNNFIVNRVQGFEELMRSLGKYTVARLVEIIGIDEERIRTTARQFVNAENGIILYGKMALGSTILPQMLANLAMMTGKVGKPNNGLIALLPGGNSRGALDMGVRPDAGTADKKRKVAGMGASEMWDAANAGRLQGMYVAGLNPAATNPQAAQSLQKVGFLVVQDLFMTETAQLADVVLPAAAFAERDGTFTNAERRVQRFRKARSAPADLPSDWEIFQNVARAVLAPVAAVILSSNGQGGGGATVATSNTWDYIVPSDVAEEISRTITGYTRTNYTSLELTKKSWGRQTNEAFYYDGTSYENTEGVGVALPTRADESRGMLSFVSQEPTAPLTPDQQYPLVLMTPTRLYGGGEWLRGSKLASRVPPAHAILNRIDAEKLGVALGEKVRIESKSGTLELPIQIDAGLAEGLVLVPSVQGAEAAQIATGPQTRVAVRKVE
ncbi:MAG: NADH dehydrogenase (quinone) subunit G [Chloroflexi bacterium AL-W]|nr:NADH dehydrogenase (quinone) subunit G [Chloroflexi bacterium AL-N1]NOK69411.1 NADH dehydrogenase (quinone) subunit G [Chloroflexi bacterium AL-N10]NOK76472.1 NADH dehydrogenase (quinone) subunit G [Chloroflexi bacterium AL-N5]NOK83589.1 NADH dehydrogenase (quinone) subunit G [Chloroflexi bacterium AL-W]NOK91250.1 NADH dehydrogenase (quinone) subunit G [Chloroflexi bacterium AL-N15]